MLVYCPYVNMVESFAEKLRCNAYHATAKAKDQILEDFVARKSRLLIATSALGLGLDKSDIDYVIHAYSL